MSRETVHSRSYATLFRHSAVLSLPAVLLRKFPITTDHNNTLSDAIKMAGDNTCSFAVIIKGNCGQNRGEENVIFLHECSHDISNNPRECHLSGEKLTEVNLILARAGLFDLGMSKVKEMTIYPTHRNNLGR